MTQQETHAAAMEQTAAFYDHIVSTPTRNTPLYGLNSLAPFWAIEGSITGGMWGPSTEFTEHACAVTDAYEFKPRYETRKYPALETDEGRILDSEYEFYETKSLVFRFGDDDLPPGVQYQDEAGAGSYPSEARPEQSKPDDTDPDDNYRRVSDAELNSEYAKFVDGTGKEESMLETLLAFADGKLSHGFKESNLRPVERDQLLSKFMEKMDRAIREGMYSGTDGKPFSNYVKSAWANIRADAYDRQNRQEDRYESSTFGFDEGQNEDSYASTEDAAAFITYRDSRPDQDRETVLLIHELRSRLSKADLAIFESLRDSNQKETADRLGINRHSVARAQERIEKAGRKAIVRLSFPKVGA